MAASGSGMSGAPESAVSPEAGGADDREGRERHERRRLRRWYAWLLGGVLPVLLLGFVYSALADRLIFAGWGLAIAVAYTVALRQGMEAEWTGPVLAGALALLLAAGLAWFSTLERTHREILDLGFRAVLPSLYHPAATAPRSAGAVAVTLALAGVAALAGGLWRRRGAR